MSNYDSFTSTVQVYMPFISSLCDFALVYVRVCSIFQLCLTLCDPMDCSPAGSSVHGISQARILERVAISSSRGSSRPRDCPCVSCGPCIGRQILYS